MCLHKRTDTTTHPPELPVTQSTCAKTLTLTGDALQRCWQPKTDCHIYERDWCQCSCKWHRKGKKITFQFQRSVTIKIKILFPTQFYGASEICLLTPWGFVQSEVSGVKNVLIPSNWKTPQIINKTGCNPLHYDSIEKIYIRLYLKLLIPTFSEVKCLLTVCQWKTI